MNTLESIAPYAFWFLAIMAAAIAAVVFAYQRGRKDGWDERNQIGSPVIRLRKRK